MAESQYIRGTDPLYSADGIEVFHGDCREILPRLEQCDLVLTDPPYGHNNNNGDLISKWEAALGKGDSPESGYRPIANDDAASASELVRFVFAEAARMLPPGCCCCCCCCGGGGPDPQFARWSLWLDEFVPFKQMIVWDKGPMGMGWHYRRSYEVVLVAQKPGKARWNGGRSTENILRPGKYGRAKIIPRAGDHPTPKPVWLMEKFIEWHTNEGDLVVDPCMGGGTTLVAAQRLGRRAIGIDVEQKYCDMAIRDLRQRMLQSA